MHLRAACLQQGFFLVDWKKIWSFDLKRHVLRFIANLFVSFWSMQSSLCKKQKQTRISIISVNQILNTMHTSYTSFRSLHCSYERVMNKSVWRCLMTDEAPPWIGNTVLVEFFLLFIESESAAGYFQYKYLSNSSWHTLRWQSILGSRSLCEQKDVAIKYSSNISWLHYHC